jgi:hypothetical protein
MGRVFDFAKRRIVGYVVFWMLVLLFLGIFYPGNQPAQAGALIVVGFAFLGSLLYTRRMKRKQRARREAEQARRAYEKGQMVPVMAPPMGQAQRAQQMQTTQRPGGR